VALRDYQMGAQFAPIALFQGLALEDSLFSQKGKVALVNRVVPHQLGERKIVSLKRAKPKILVLAGGDLHEARFMILRHLRNSDNLKIDSISLMQWRPAPGKLLK